MKKLITIALLGLAISGAGCSDRYRPNTRKGWHVDEINKHTDRIGELNTVIYKQNSQRLPEKAAQLDEAISWQEKMRSRMRGMNGGK